MTAWPTMLSTAHCLAAYMLLLVVFIIAWVFVPIAPDPERGPFEEEK